MSELFGFRQRVQSLEPVQAGDDRAALRDEPVRRARHRGAPIRQVDAGFDAFVSDPIGIAS